MLTKEEFEKIKTESPESRIGKMSWEEYEVRSSLAKILSKKRSTEKLKTEKENSLIDVYKFCESFCLEKLSKSGNFSEDELFLIEQGNKYGGSILHYGELNKDSDEEETKEETKEETTEQQGLRIIQYIKKLFSKSDKQESEEYTMPEEYTYYKIWKPLSDKLLTRLAQLPEDERLICSRYLAGKNMIICGRAKGEGLGFYYTDYESIVCSETIKTLKELGLDKYVSYIGDSCYNIGDWRIEPIIDKTQGGIIHKTKEEIEQLKGELSDLEMEQQELETKKEALEKYGQPIEKSLDILEWTREFSHKKDIKIDQEHNTYVILSEYSRDSGYAGMEYGMIIGVKRGSNTQRIAVKYRDASDYRKDDWGKCYDKIDDVRIEGDKVFVTVSSSKRSDTYEFDISEGLESVEFLDFEAQKQFQIRVKQEIERLLDVNTKKLTYMARNDLDLMTTLGSTAMDAETEFSYQKPIIIDKKISIIKGIACIEIKAQTDASGAEGKEYAFIKYEITPTETREIGRRYFRQGDRRF